MGFTMRKQRGGYVRNFKKTLDAIDDALTEHVKSQRGQSSIVTGWVLVASVSDSDNPEHDGYILQSSAALSHHTQVGLLNVALDDKRNISLLSTINSVMGDE